MRTGKTLALLVVVLLLFFPFPSAASADSNIERLRRAMAELSLLNSQLAERRMEAEEIREALSNRYKEIKQEFVNEIRSSGITEKKEALKHPRVFYNLMLLAEIRAYFDRYTHKIGFYKVACDRLGYLYQQADDDLKIVSALSGMQVDALVSQASRLTETYLSEAQTILIEPQLIVVDSPDKLWEGLSSSL